MVIKKITIFIILIFVPALCLAAEQADLKYPGNGIPLLSKNKPVTILNKEIGGFLAGKDKFAKKAESVCVSFKWAHIARRGLV